MVEGDLVVHVLSGHEGVIQYRDCLDGYRRLEGRGQYSPFTSKPPNMRDYRPVSDRFQYLVKFWDGTEFSMITCHPSELKMKKGK